MAGTIKVKRSAVAGKVPSTTDLAVGEIGANTQDGRLFLGGSNGATPFVQEFLKVDAAGNISPSGNVTAGGYISASGFIESFATTATAGGTTALTAASATVQQFTGTLSQTVTLPAANSLTVGRIFTVLNRSTNNVTVNGNGGAQLSIIPAGSQVDFRVTSIGSAAGTWDVASSSSGSASGQGGINYVTNYNFENDTSGYALYVDAAGALPVNAAGTGTSTITFARTTTNPLRGLASGLLSKPASNAQGQGVAYAFAVDRTDQAKVLQISADYTVDSGTYADGDLSVYIVDVTNNQVIQPVGYQIKSVTSGNYAKLSASFQTSSNSTSYRLAFHVASTSAVAYALRIDNINVGPVPVIQGAVITAWQDYTPTVQGVTASVRYAQWRRVGSNIELKAAFGTSAVAASILKVSLPSGLSILSSGNTDNLLEGTFTCTYQGGTQAGVTPFSQSGDPTNISFTLNNARSGENPVNGNGVMSAGDRFYFTAIAPIQGWSAMANLGGADDARVTAMSVIANASITGAAGSTVKFQSVNYDTHAGYSAALGQYVVPTPGIYRSTVSNFSFGTTGNTYWFLTRNGVNVNGNTHGLTNADMAYGSVSVKCNAGDVLAIVNANGITLNYSAGNYAAQWDIEKVLGAATIQAAESVNCRYTTASGTIGASDSITKYGVKTYDSHGAYNPQTGVYTVPVSGKYKVNAQAYITASYGQGQGVFISIYKNGAIVSNSSFKAQVAISFTISLPTFDTVPCIAGDQIAVYVSTNGSSASYAGSAFSDLLIIEKVGN